MEEYSEILPVGDIGEYELLPVPKVEELGYGDISQVRALAHVIQSTNCSMRFEIHLTGWSFICRRRFRHSAAARQKL